MKKNLVFRFISLVLTSVMVLGLLPALGVMAADEDSTVNVALGKTVIAGNPKLTNASGLVNGSYTDLIYPFGSDNTGAYTQGSVILPSGAVISSATHQKDDWFIVDLGERCDISEVKLWSRRDQYYSAYMQYFDIEASNVEDFSSYVKLGGVGSDPAGAGVGKETPFVAEGDGNFYRYIRVKRTNNSAYGYSELEVFAKNTTDTIPKVTKVVNEDGKVVVSFSEKMDANTIIADNFTFSDSSADISAPVLSEGWDGGYDVTFTVTGDQPEGTLTVSSNVKAENEASVAENTVIQLGYHKTDINKNYSKTIQNVNVAHRKPVTCNVDSMGSSRLTNGLDDEWYAIAKNTGVYHTVDLGQRYNIKKIKLHSNKRDGYVASQLRYTSIIGSNTADFSVATTLGSVSASSTSSVYEIELDGTQAYRYIRVQKTAGSDECRYGELEVYADVDVTEVSRGAQATAAQEKYNANQATDGTVDGYNGWGVSSAPGSAHNNLIIDLGKEYPVDMVEIYGRPGFTAVAYSKQITGIGYSEADWEKAGMPIYTGVELNATGKIYTKTLFTRTASSIGDSGVVLSFAKPDCRYLVISKTINEVVWLSEVRAFVSNPMLLGAKINNDDTVTVTFSHELDPTTVPASDFSITGVNITDAELSADGYEVTLTYDGKIKNGAVLTASETIRSKDGIEMAEDGSYTFDFVTNMVLKEGEADAEGTVDTNTTYTFTANYNGKVQSTGNVYIALKKDTDSTATVLETLIKANKADFTADANGKAALTVTLDTTDIDVEGCWIEVYVWDDDLSPYMTGKYTFGN